jgi:hypothetical protein
MLCTSLFTLLSILLHFPCCYAARFSYLGSLRYQIGVRVLTCFYVSGAALYLCSHYHLDSTVSVVCAALFSAHCLEFPSHPSIWLEEFVFSHAFMFQVLSGGDCLQCHRM